MMNWSTYTSEPVGVSVATRTSLLSDLDACLAAGRGFTVATLNLDHVVKIRRDPTFRNAYARQSHVVADGNPIVWLERLAGRRIGLTPGSELVEPVAELAARHDVPVALVGSTDAALARAGDRLAEQYPGLRIAARIAPAMGFDPEGPGADAIIDELASSGARLCFLALGAPRQEIFAARASDRLPQVGFLSIGAGLDFLAKTQVRAPKWVRALAAEWIWRLGSNPRRLAGRYASCITILPSLAATAVKSRGQRQRPDV